MEGSQIKREATTRPENRWSFHLTEQRHQTPALDTNQLFHRDRRRTMLTRNHKFGMVFLISLIFASTSSALAPTSAPAVLQPSPVSPPSTGVSPSVVPTRRPTKYPTVSPSDHPTHYPTHGQSSIPSNTIQSTTISTTTLLPSQQPTDSPAPTSSPSNLPSTTSKPSNKASSSPSYIQSMLPSVVPTPYPSFVVESRDSAGFSQRFLVNDNMLFDELEQEIFGMVMESYTDDIAAQVKADPDLIYSLCGFEYQRLEQGQIFSTPTPTSSPSVNSTLSRTLQNSSGRNRKLDQTVSEVVASFVQVEFSLTYWSMYVNVSTFPELFLLLISNMNLLNLTQNMQAAGLNISESLQPFIIWVNEAPTNPPSLFPTSAPSPAPSLVPSEHPSSFPSISQPSFIPSVMTIEPSYAPSLRPTAAPSSGLSYAVIAVVAFGSGAAVVLLIIFLSYCMRKRRSKLEAEAAAISALRQSLNDNYTKDSSPLNYRVNASSAFRDPFASPRNDGNMGELISPNDSLLSNQSLLSACNDLGGDSGDEEDNTHYLADEFDQYKDQNLEKMRNEIEGNVRGVDGMMSQAMTKALLDDEESLIDRNNLYWGGQGDPTEIEATALSEVYDWMKREEGATIEERRGFMQETLNKMVSSVRHGVMGPDLASQTIHECAALLGLQLASDLDEVSIIVTGMRKTVTTRDLVAGFSEFGEIDDAAVSSNSRGFGLIRFESPKAVQRALEKFRREEIVVQDVAVTIKVLSSEESGRPVIGTSASREGSTVPSTADTE